MQKFNKVAVIGGTGKAGKYLVNQLVSKGFRLRLLLRDPAKYEYQTGAALELVQGDVTDFESIKKLVEGCDAVISALGQRKDEPPVFSKAATNIVQAMNEHAIKRYIWITGLTLDSDGDQKRFRTRMLSKMMKWIFPSIVADKQGEFQIISASKLDWTVVRLPFIEMTPSRGEVQFSLTDCPGKKISVTDLAGFLIAQIMDDAFIRKAPFVANRR